MWFGDAMGWMERPYPVQGRTIMKHSDEGRSILASFLIDTVIDINCGSSSLMVVVVMRRSVEFEAMAGEETSTRTTENVSTNDELPPKERKPKDYIPKTQSLQ